LEFLVVENLVAGINSTVVLKGVNLEINRGEIHVIVGPNAVGKSTLLAAIMGLSHVKILKGKIVFEGKDITNLKPFERARLGISLGYQIPPEFRGVKLRTLVEEVAGKYGCMKYMDTLIDFLDLRDLLDREAFRGFSGGERKRAELLLTFLQKPKLAMLDEPDSGVDIESIKLIGEAIKFAKNELNTSILLVTHTGEILREIGRIDSTHVLYDGRIVYSGSSEEVFEKIRKHGFKGVVEVERVKG